MDVVMTARLCFGPRRSADPVLQFLRWCSRGTTTILRARGACDSKTV